MSTAERELDVLLGLVARHVDRDHCRAVDRRYRRALACEPVDRPPLVVQASFGEDLELPEPWSGFRRYTYREGFDDPAAMMQNMLLARVVPGLLLKDDNPLAIRNDHGTVQVSSLLGGTWHLHEDNYPWLESFHNTAAIERIAGASDLDVENSVMQRSFNTLEFYKDRLAAHPPLDEFIQISMPDLQGPMDTAEQLWGSDIYYAFVDKRDLLDRLLARVVEATVELSEKYRRLAHDRLEPFANTQHGYVIPGRLLIRNDSAIMLSPAMYADVVRPHDARLLNSVGKGAIHFCGNGEHLIDKMVEIPDLLGIDLGQPEMMNVPRIHALCLERKVALTNIQPSRDDLISGKARRDFPTGCVMIYVTRDCEDAREVVRAYQSR